MAVGLVALLEVVKHNGLDVTTLQLAGPQAVAGVGIGLVVAPLFSLILAAVADEEVGSASGVLNAIQQFGGAVGIAVIGTVFFTVLGDDGFTQAFERVVIWTLALVGVAALLALLLPMEPREEEVH